MSALPAHWRHAILSRAETAALLARAQEGDRAARDELILKNQRLVVSVAKRFTGGFLDLDDLVSAGNRGLMVAIETFDPTGGASFSTYAACGIRQRIYHELVYHARLVRIPQWAIKAVCRYRRAEQAHGGDFESVCDRIGVTRRRRRALTDALRAMDASVGSIPAARDDDAADHEPPDRAHPFDGEAGEEREIQARRVARAVTTLPPLEARVIRLVFGLGTEGPLQQAQVAEREGVSRQWISVLCRRAMRRLRRELAS